jgi:hypothetical protein
VAVEWDTYSSLILPKSTLYYKRGKSERAASIEDSYMMMDMYARVKNGLSLDIGRRRSVGAGSSGRSGSGEFLGSVFPSMGPFSVSMSEGEDELVKRSSCPNDENKEDGLDCQTRHLWKGWTYEVFKDSEKDFFLGCSSVSTYSSVYGQQRKGGTYPRHLGRS